MEMNMNNGSGMAMPRPNMTKEEYEKWQMRKQAWENIKERAKEPLLFPLPEDDPYYKKAREIIYRERGLIP
ncbi:MAG: hypothetical protein LBL98_01695 [Ruminococcus sp.]|jgi:hypothetical protein|nr:hypothetical protein [Ruminococcus sp.]